MTLVHVRGVGPGRIVQNVLAAAKVTFLIMLVLLGFGLGDGSWAHIEAPRPLGAGSWLLALVPVMFSYAGWNAASYVAEEIRNPERFVPRALALGTGAVVLLYVALNLLYVYSIPVTELAALKGSVMDVIAERLFGARAGDLMAVMTAVSIAASVSAMIIAGPRVYFAMARDGLFFRKAVEIHPALRHAVQLHPRAVGVERAAGPVGQLQPADHLHRVFGRALLGHRGRWRCSSCGCAIPTSRGRFARGGIRVMPGLFVLASALIVGNAIWRDPGPSAAGLGIICAGLPLYFYLQTSYVGRNFSSGVGRNFSSGGLRTELSGRL